MILKLTEGALPEWVDIAMSYSDYCPIKLENRTVNVMLDWIGKIEASMFKSSSWKLVCY